MNFFVIQNSVRIYFWSNLHKCRVSKQKNYSNYYKWKKACIFAMKRGFHDLGNKKGDFKLILIIWIEKGDKRGYFWQIWSDFSNWASGHPALLVLNRRSMETTNVKLCIYLCYHLPIYRNSGVCHWCLLTL